MHQPKDYIQQLADYIKTNLSKGYTIDSLKFSLINQGYSRISVNKAIDLANKQLAKIAPIMKEKPKIIYKVIKEDFSKQIYKLPKKNFLKKLFDFLK